MQRIVRAFPVKPGREDQARQVAEALGSTRAAEAAAFYKKFGVAHECWYAQQSGDGLQVIAITDFDGRPPMEAAAEYAASNEPFEAWFKQQVLEITGCDQSTDPLGPPAECVFDWPPRHL